VYIFCCLEIIFKCYRLKLLRNLKFLYSLTLFDLQWLKLTFKKQNICIFGISEQFSTRKSTISMCRATSNFDLHMRICNLQGLGCPDHKTKPYLFFIKLRKMTKLILCMKYFFTLSVNKMHKLHLWTKAFSVPQENVKIYKMLFIIVSVCRFRGQILFCCFFFGQTQKTLLRPMGLY
jgi:hypothetical protein